jgi:hypothetical protein
VEVGGGKKKKRAERTQRPHEAKAPLQKKNSKGLVGDSTVEIRGPCRAGFGRWVVICGVFSPGRLRPLTSPLGLRRLWLRGEGLPLCGVSCYWSRPCWAALPPLKGVQLPGFRVPLPCVGYLGGWNLRRLVLACLAAGLAGMFRPWALSRFVVAVTAALPQRPELSSAGVAMVLPW